MAAFTPSISAGAARQQLIDLFNAHQTSTIYTIVRHVSQSGMSRRITLHAVQGADIINLTPRVAAILGEKVDDRDLSITVRGAGMDMAWHLVYRLSSALYEGDGYQLDQRVL